MTATGTLLELAGVTKTYADLGQATPVLKGVDLSVASGESVAIVGPSGCGKSTLLNIAGTLDAPDTGRVTFDGRSLSDLSPREAARFRNDSIGFVFQLHHLLPQCSVLENVLVPTLVHAKAEDTVARARELLDRVGLTDRVDHRPGQLSGGERQRVAVVRALINQPAMLLADEPTGSLSADGALDLARLMLALNRETGLTLIVVTHSLEVAGMLGRVLELRDGVLHPHGNGE